MVNKYYFTNIQNKKHSFICIAEYIEWENSKDQEIDLSCTNKKIHSSHNRLG